MSEKRRWIFFDCMETLVDLTELPVLRDYAAWAFEGAGVEDFFGSFEEYFTLYQRVRDDQAARLHKHQEYDMRERVLLISQLAARGDHAAADSVSEALHSNYWKNYKARCYVKDEVREVLQRLSGSFKLGVVSNFMVQQGIEEMLELFDIRKHFDFVVTSINTGWKKPHANIYDTALKSAGISPSEVIFVGDDYVNDYVAPRELGMRSILLDRSGKYDKIESRIDSFHQLENQINLL